MPELHEQELPLEPVPSMEEIDQHFKALDDSVGLIEKLKAGDTMGMSPEEVADCIDRNEQHIEIMLAKSFIASDARAVNYQ